MRSSLMGHKAYLGIIQNNNNIEELIEKTSVNRKRSNYLNKFHSFLTTHFTFLIFLYIYMHLINEYKSSSSTQAGNKKVKKCL